MSRPPSARSSQPLRKTARVLGTGRKRSTCRNDGTTDSISDNGVTYHFRLAGKSK
nr:MAG TPA: hypothetical protein [Caudoviricetes sp.]